MQLLGRQLQRARRRGRTPAGEAVGGFVIEEGEAEGLVEELLGEWAGEPTGEPTGPPVAAPQELVPASPLSRTRRVFELSPHEYDAFLLALAVECDARVGRLIAFLNDHAGHTRPTVGLALAIAGRNDPQAVPALLGRPLIVDGLLELEGDGPLPGRTLRLAPELLARIIDMNEVGDGSAPGVRLLPADPERLAQLVLEDEVRRRLDRWAALARAGTPPPLLVAGESGSGRTTAAAAAAGRAGFALVAVDVRPETLGAALRRGRREARWHGAALCVRVDSPLTHLNHPHEEWRVLWEGLRGFPQPVAVVLPSVSCESAAAAAPEEPAIVQLSPPRAELRAALWRALLPGVHDEQALASLGPNFQFGPGRIARAVRRAAGDHLLEGRDGPPTVHDVIRAARAVGSAAMSSLAQRLPLPYSRDQLVVLPRTGRELDLAVAWMRHRLTVFERWGFAKRIAFGRGLTALFCGPPGTGKTMAAQVLTRDLGLELYRVDLSRVMSKYIGETEKNLGRLFDEAYASGAVLFFDEADVLFGKRSEVRDAHDRYANLEVGYLLQRMEEHDGVSILATNRSGDMDEAFLRRFHFILDFPMPERDERLRIWRGMLPPEAEREPHLDLEALAEAIDASGGEIRNAVLIGAYLAADEGRPIGLTHLKKALRREMLKNGRVLDERARRVLDGG
ncbi:MAG TPA: ATP-binding protein [Polyangia bacterium]|nr:ATP-binding protein [Polyangia bacterium]